MVCGFRGMVINDSRTIGSSPPRPTIQIISKYAAILTFPLFADLAQKTVLSTICQLYDWPDGTALMALRPFG